jgi:UDP-glucose 4-epimerase
MNLVDKTILVTGGTGFIGSHIVNKLINQGCFVNIFDINNSGEWRIDTKSNYNLTIIDLTDEKAVEKNINMIKPDIIFHLAGFVSTSRDSKIINDMININFTGTKNLIMALQDMNYELFINTGSSDEYGQNMVPFKETLKEMPVSAYAASKIAATYFCDMMNKVNDKPIITVRPFLVFGPKQLSRMLIPWLIYSCVKEKELDLTLCEQTRDFIFVEDVADAYILLAFNAQKVKNMGIFNIGSGYETKIIEIVKMIQSKMNNDSFNIGKREYKKGEAMESVASIKKIDDAIKWKPKSNVKDSIDKTINWWIENRTIWEKYQSIWK